MQILLVVLSVHSMFYLPDTAFIADMYRKGEASVVRGLVSYELG